MKFDRTLIDKEGVPTREEIKAYHEKKRYNRCRFVV